MPTGYEKPTITPLYGQTTAEPEPLIIFAWVAIGVAVGRAFTIQPMPVALLFPPLAF